MRRRRGHPPRIERLVLHLEAGSEVLWKVFVLVDRWPGWGCLLLELAYLPLLLDNLLLDALNVDEQLFHLTRLDQTDVSVLLYENLFKTVRSIPVPQPTHSNLLI